ncbi:MAG: T9SS type A sorting domain-containing protein [Bacteroidales bacterium]|nr:T9SS type A sorting domain-containing protein [Bacteroidales bacterium]
MKTQLTQTIAGKWQIFLCLIFLTTIAFGQGVPELIYYKFDAVGDQTNYASAPVGNNPAPILGTFSIGGTGQFGTALTSTGGVSSTNYLNTGWPVDLPGTGFTISFWMNNIPSSTTLYYIFGDNTATSFRCFIGGVAGIGNIIIRGGGLSDLIISGIAPGPSVIHFVYDGTNIIGYLNGVLNNSVADASIDVTGTTGPFKIGGYSTSTGMPADSYIDEFRVYNRALSATEISQTWNQPLPIASTPTVTTTAITSITTITAKSGGNITDEGATAVTARGVCWNTTGTPTITDDLTTDGTGTGIFTSNITGLTPSTLYYVRSYATNSEGTAYGNEESFTTLACIDPTDGGTIAANQFACGSLDPSEITSTTLPTGHTGTLEYKWQESTTSSSAGFSDITATNSATYDPSSISITTWYKRLARVDCMSDWTGAVESNVLEMTVYPTFMVGSISADQSICYNTSPVELIGVAPTGGNTPYTYQWQSSTDGSTFADIVGATSLNYTPGLLTTTTYFQLIQSSSSGCGDEPTNMITITVYDEFVLGSISDDQSICYNTIPAELTGVAPTGGSAPYTYQWQSSTDNSTFTDIAGATSLNYTPGAHTETTYYKLNQTSTCSSSLPPLTLTLGTGTVTQGYPFYTFYMDSRTQMLYPASEIIAAGGSAGEISWIAYDVTSAASQTMNNFNIQMANVSNTSITGWNNDMTTVFDGTFSVPGTGWQQIALQTPFIWDGVSNLLVSVCFNNNSYTSNSYMRCTYESGMTRHYHFDGSSTSGCETTSGSSYSYRPNMQFYVTPLVDNSTNVVTVTVYPDFVVGSISADQNICYNTTPSELTGTAPTGGNTPYSYQWQSSTDNITFTDITGATSLNYQPGVITQTTYYQQIQYSATDCGSGTTNPVMVTTQLPASADAGLPETICPAGSYTCNGSAQYYSALLWSSSGTGSFDDATSLTATYTPSAGDIVAGSVTLTLTATPLSPCTTPALSNVVVPIGDVILPTVNTQNITVQLDENGQASIITTDIDNGSTDNCAIATMSLDITDFDCDDIGPNTVILTVDDVNGNSNTNTAVVTVEDNITPTIVNPGNQEIISGLTCLGTLADFTIDLEYSDNCQIESVIQTPAPGTIYDLNAGIILVTIEVTDVNDNSNSVSFDVTFEDQYAFTITGVESGNITTCNEWPDGYIIINTTLDSNLLMYSIYNYNTWQGYNNHFNDLAAGTYHVKAKNFNGCIQEWAEPIEILPAPEVILNTIAVTHIESCYGSETGSIEVLASGGSGSFQYSIDNGESWQASYAFYNLAAGTYFVQIIDDAGCGYIHQDPIIVTQPYQLLISEVEHTNVEGCFGNANATIDITATGGTPPYQYSIDYGQNWSSEGDFTDLTIGNYWIKIKDASDCMLIYENNPITITQPSQLAISNIEMSPVVCEQETVSFEIFSIGGTGNIEFSIDNGATWSSSGEFTLYSNELYYAAIRDENGCEQFYENNPVSFQAIFASDVNIEVSPANEVCEGETITLTAICEDEVNYLWSPGNSTSEILNIAETVGTYNYTVAATNLFNCTSQESVEITFVDCTNVNDTDASVIILFPNPNTGEFTLEINTNTLPEAIRIYSAQGKMVFEQSSKELITNLMTFNLSNLHPGVYYTQIEFDGKVMIKKMIIQE